MRLLPGFLPVLLLIIWLPVLVLWWADRGLVVRQLRGVWRNVVFWGVPTLFTVLFTAMLLGFGKTIVAYAPRVILLVLLLFVLIYLPLLLLSLMILVDLVVKGFSKSHRWLCTIYIGLPMALVVACMLLFGFCNRHALRVKAYTLNSTTLPSAFDGTRVAVIADLHLGNLIGGTHFLSKVVESINAVEPNYVFLVGDLVNLNWTEILDYQALLSTIRAVDGKYAVMGNHDYGDYYPWSSEGAYLGNIERVQEGYELCGFRLLNNTSVMVVKDSTSCLNIIGVENIGTGPFHCSGDVDAAMASCAPAPFNILLSHDPTAWKAFVVNKYPQISLTISGHTHASQMGLQRPHFSPAQWLYREWEGAYRSGLQWIYVNRGLGYVGLPIRIGMNPEVTVITLRCAPVDTFEPATLELP